MEDKFNFLDDVVTDDEQYGKVTGFDLCMGERYVDIVTTDKRRISVPRADVRKVTRSKGGRVYQ